MSNILGGLVGITAGADLLSPTQAILIGLIAGVVVILAVRLIDRLHLDNPVGAIPVHLFCGFWRDDKLESTLDSIFFLTDYWFVLYGFFCNHYVSAKIFSWHRCKQQSRN